MGTADISSLSGVGISDEIYGGNYCSCDAVFRACILGVWRLFGHAFFIKGCRVEPNARGGKTRLRVDTMVILSGLHFHLVE